MILGAKQEEVLWYTNHDLKHVYTPVNPNALHELLKESQYDKLKTEKLVNGFKYGFDLGYRNSDKVQLESRNLKLTIGSETELWNKVMKEVSLKRYAGPFDEIPYTKDFIQSPIGLVPKDGGKKTRLIFHLSHPRKDTTSVNFNTPQEFTTVKYYDFDDAIRICLREGKGCKIAKSDLSSAFRHLCLNPRFWRYLVMKARHPVTGKTFYFIDKCLPFGASISCALFQELSDAISHIVQFKTKKENINYLDDFFFAHILRKLCNRQVEIFLDICEQISFPVSLDKTFWGTTELVFLGLLINTRKQRISIPIAKLIRARSLIEFMITKANKKITLRQLQQLCGYLNFLCKAIVPGRAFTRRLYAFGRKLTKPHHHLRITREFRLDLYVWKQMLLNQSYYSRPFFHMDETIKPTQLFFMTDASRNQTLGCGGVCNDEWFIMQWEESFVKKCKPSIAFLELFALVVGIVSWLHKFKNKKIALFCDNQSVVSMVNKTSSKCPHCMKLIRIMVCYMVEYNAKVYCNYINTKQNIYADYLSRLKYKLFWQTARKNGRTFKSSPQKIPEFLLPLEKFF